MNLLNILLLLAFAILLNGAAAIDIQVFGHVINIDDPINIAVAISAEALATYAFRLYNKRFPTERESTPYEMMSEDIIESVFYIDRGYVDKVTLATRLTKDNVSLSAIEYNNDDGSSFAKTMDPHIYILTISGLCVAVFLRRAYSRLVWLQNPEIYTLHATANNPQAYIRDARGLKGADMQIILFKKGAVGTDAGRLKQIHTDTVGINRNTAQPSAGRSEIGNLKAVDTTEYPAMPAANGSDNAMPSRNVTAPTSQSGCSRRKRENRRSRKISLSKLAVGTSNQGREVTVF